MQTKTTTNLDALIPPPSVGLGYINRELASGYTDFQMFDAAMESGHNVLLKGPTGSGKTYSSRAYASARELPHLTIPVNGALDVAAVLGGFAPKMDGTGLEWHYGKLAQMIQERRGVVLWDEMAMGVERNLALFYGLWDSRRELSLVEHFGEVLKVQPGSDLLFMGAYNPGYHGGRPLSQALPNRFAFKATFDYDPRIEATLVPSSALIEVAGKFRAMSREIRTPVSTNMMVEFCEIAMAFDVDFAIANWVEAFTDTEQDSVANLMDLYKVSISQDVAAALAILEAE